MGGPCGEVDRQRTLTVAATPHLSVAFLEVTQGLQNTAHTVRLVAGRTTGVRAYLTSGLGGFSYTGTPGEVANVTGTLRVERGGVVVASIPAAGPVTVGNTFVDADRSGFAHALVFKVPGSLMDGDVTMRVSAKVGRPARLRERHPGDQRLPNCAYRAAGHPRRGAAPDGPDQPGAPGGRAERGRLAGVLRRHAGPLPSWRRRHVGGGARDG